jgi:hypothetical protein
MSGTSCTIDGQTFVWEPTSSSKDASRAACVVYWLRKDADGARIEIGRLKRWRSGAGWVVHPRLGGTIRAREERRGLSASRLVGIRYLLDLARSETTLSVLDKLRLRILREEGEIIRDLGAELVPVPPLAA